MDKLAQLIEETTDVRELKRALSVKLREGGMAAEAVGEVLQVTPRAVRAPRFAFRRSVSKCASRRASGATVSAGCERSCAIGRFPRVRAGRESAAVYINTDFDRRV